MYMATADPPRKAARPRSCNYCGERFYPAHAARAQRFCTIQCKLSARNDGPTLEQSIELTERWVEEEVARLAATPSLIPWVERKLREAYGLDLRYCDRKQVSEQMEDLWL